MSVTIRPLCRARRSSQTNSASLPLTCLLASSNAPIPRDCADPMASKRLPHWAASIARHQLSEIANVDELWGAPDAPVPTPAHHVRRDVASR